MGYSGIARQAGPGREELVARFTLVGFDEAQLWGRVRMGRGHFAVLVPSPVVALVLAGLVKVPVLVEVLAGAQGAKAQYGFAAGQTPAGAGEPHAIADQVAGGAFDDARADGQTRRQVLVVAQIARVVEQVVGAGVHRLAVLVRQFPLGGATAHATGDLTGVAPQDSLQPLWSYPGLVDTSILE